METLPELKHTKTEGKSFSLLELCFPDHPDSEDYEFWDDFDSSVSWQEAIERLSNAGAALAAKIHPDWKVIEVGLNFDDIFVQYERPLTPEELQEKSRRAQAAKLGKERRKANERDKLRQQLDTIRKNHPDLLEEATLKLYE